MTMSLIFIAGFLCVLLLPLTCLSILFALQSQINIPSSTSTSTPTPSTSAPNAKHNILHSYLTHSHLSSFWKLLLHHSLCPDSSVACNNPPAMLYGSAGEAEEECSVCLCRIQQGEEVRELRCHHLFHSPCLDSWVGTGRLTCPLCRGTVSFPAFDSGAELLLFRFCSFGDGHRQDNWWLR